MKVSILGVAFDAVSPGEALDAAALVLREPRSERMRYIVTPNPEMVNLSMRDPAFKDMLNGAKLVLPDGIGIIYASRIFKTPIRERVTGIDFAAELFRYCAQTEVPVYLLGAAPGVAETARIRLESDYPGLRITGTHDGYYGDERQIIEDINASGAELLIVCLGFPKQEKFMAQNADKLSPKLAVGLGGALDIWSGKLKRAPRFMQKAGLEWFYRLITQPRRLGRMLKLPVFLMTAFRNRKQVNES